MAENVPRPQSSITWFYYDDVAIATSFYGETLGLEQVLDQGWASVFRIARDAFVGLVDAQAGKGTCRPQPTNAVLLTLVVDDLQGWFDRLTAAGIRLDSGITKMADLEIETFFLTDPGGYRLEFQRFLHEAARKTFHGS